MVNLFVFLFCAILAVLLVKGVELKGITVIDKVETFKIKDSSIRRIVMKSLGFGSIFKANCPNTNLIRAPMCLGTLLMISLSVMRIRSLISI